MIDFQGIHARHLEVFRDYAAFRHEHLEPTRKAQVKIARVKQLTLLAKQQISTKSIFLPAEIIGQRIDLLV